MPETRLTYCLPVGWKRARAVFAAMAWARSRSHLFEALAATVTACLVDKSLSSRREDWGGAQLRFVLSHSFPGIQ